jgi:hypothetical protein
MLNARLHPRPPRQHRRPERPGTGFDARRRRRRDGHRRRTEAPVEQHLRHQHHGLGGGFLAGAGTDARADGLCQVLQAGPRRLDRMAGMPWRARPRLKPVTAPLVSVDSEAPGKEAYFVIELPMCTMGPPSPIWRTASWVATNTPVTLTAIMGW